MTTLYVLETPNGEGVDIGGIGVLLDSIVDTVTVDIDYDSLDIDVWKDSNIAPGVVKGRYINLGPLDSVNIKQDSADRSIPGGSTSGKGVGKFNEVLTVGSEDTEVGKQTVKRTTRYINRAGTGRPGG